VVGGLLILLGVAVDLASILVIVEMLGAIFLVHLPNGFDFTKGGWEHPFTVLVMALALALSGPGQHAVGKQDYKGADRRRK
jgi:putative oxidoreductase